MTKLSKTQQEVLNKIINDVTEAHRTNELDVYNNWYYQPYRMSLENRKQSAEFGVKCWKEKMGGKVKVHANTKTLEKLEKLGYIKMLGNDGFGIIDADTVQLLHY